MKAGDLKPGDVFTEEDGVRLMLCIKECEFLRKSALWDNGRVPFIYLHNPEDVSLFEIFSRDEDDEVELINLEKLK